jgi:gliding-associated putative ABC transporter substrate-binding component GldG
MMKSRLKIQEIGRFASIFVIILLSNILLSGFFFRLDLTEDKRFSISKATREILKSLKGPVFVEVYLEGEFPAGFKRLQQSVREMLEEFRACSGDKLDFQFADPSSAPDAKTRNKTYEQLTKLGLQPTNLMVRQGAEQVQKIIFPGAVVRVKGKEIPVQLLKGNQAASPAERLNQSVEGVEFELANGIKTATSERVSRIAVLTGHGEATDRRMQDFGLSLRQFYDVRKVDLTVVENLNDFDLAILIKPRLGFSEFDKFKLDQFVVKGGKLLMMLDGIQAELDSIRPEGSLAVPYDTKLDDLLFRFGVRLNADLLLDMNSGAIPLVVGYLGDKPETRLVPWRFFPVLNTFGKHPIVRNMDALYGHFVSTIDTTIQPGIRKTPLVMSSPYSRILASPVRLSFNEARLNPQPEQYKKKDLPVAYLLEGRFTSLYQNRMLPDASNKLAFKESGKKSAVVVIGDGDFARNDTNKTGDFFALGYDRFLRTTFANKDFLLNTIAYLLDENGVILARNKTIALRPLDLPRIGKEKLFWQLLNVAGPVALVLLFAVFRLWLRKRKYQSV